MDQSQLKELLITERKGAEQRFTALKLLERQQEIGQELRNRYRSDLIEPFQALHARCLNGTAQDQQSDSLKIVLEKSQDEYGTYVVTAAVDMTDTLNRSLGRWGFEPADGFKVTFDVCRAGAMSGDPTRAVEVFAHREAGGEEDAPVMEAPGRWTESSTAAMTAWLDATAFTAHQTLQMLDEAARDPELNPGYARNIEAFDQQQAATV